MQGSAAGGKPPESESDSEEAFLSLSPT